MSRNGSVPACIIADSLRNKAIACEVTYGCTFCFFFNETHMGVPRTEK